MLQRPEHLKVIQALHAMDSDLLLRNRCWFGGGTAIVLEMGEYRLSRDIDFLCADQDGYRELRSAVMNGGAGALFGTAVRQERDFRADQYGIRGMVSVDGFPLKFEIVREARMALDGDLHPFFRVPLLSAEDQMAEKMLANADRGRDPAAGFRDAIDLGMLIRHRGPITQGALDKTQRAYGDHVGKELRWVADALSQPAAVQKVATALSMAQPDVIGIAADLKREVDRQWPAPTTGRDHK